MTKRYSLLLMGFLWFTPPMLFARGTVLMTYNIRYDNPNDGDHIWNNRKETMVRQLEYYSPAVLGVQEALLNQLEYLDRHLPAYAYIGVGRDDGKKNGEFSAILYHTDRFRVIEDSTIWLSPTPWQISKGWDAALPRICTYGLFEDLKTGRRIWILNTHFDHRGRQAREESARVLIGHIRRINPMDLPLILMGDLNATPDDPPLKVLLAELDDPMEISEKPFYGPPWTNVGFTPRPSEKRIDYILTSGLKVRAYVHVDDRMDNRNSISDHLPVLIKIE